MASEGAPPYGVRELVVSSKVYDLDTVKRAAYRFIDRTTIDIAIRGEDIICSLQFQQGIAPASADVVVQEFKAELLDQDLRRKIADETAPLRNTILALAFAAGKPRERE